MNSEKNRISKWEIKDVITVILLSLFLIVIQFLINMVCMINHFTSMVLSIGFTMLLCAPVYYLLLCRVRRHFVTLVYTRRTDVRRYLLKNHDRTRNSRFRHRARGTVAGDLPRSRAASDGSAEGDHLPPDQRKCCSGFE